MDKKRVIIANLYPPTLSHEKAVRDATELYNLVESLGDAVVIDIVHQRGFPGNSAYIGLGKAEEIAQKIAEEEIDIVVLSGIAKPRQVYSLWNIFYKVYEHIEVWDRVDLILHIFSRHAHTAEAKLQIRRALMKHMGPRIYGMGHVLSQQAGGIGTRGIGETNVELMKRHWKEAMREIQNELNQLSKQREAVIARRKKQRIPTVSIIGYTNAGKTTLFNLLTKKQKYADNRLFATLDTVSGVLARGQNRNNIIITDTIGFIQKLPPEVIDAFRSTLLESIHADILIHVIDGTNPHMIEQYYEVENILDSLRIGDKEEILVVNKCDELSEDDKENLWKRLQRANPLFLSAKEGSGLEDLVERITYTLATQQYVLKNEKIEEEIIDADTTVTSLPTRDDITVGLRVAVNEKEEQKSGKLTVGVVEKILSRGVFHPYGIKVRLRSGVVGRVKRIYTLVV